MEVFFKIKNRTTIRPRNLTPVIYLEKSIIQIDTCTPVFIAALFTIAKTWKEPKCPLTEAYIKKMQHIYTMEYYPAIKESEIMPLVAT